MATYFNKYVQAYLFFWKKATFCCILCCITLYHGALFRGCLQLFWSPCFLALCVVYYYKYLRERERKVHRKQKSFCPCGIFELCVLFLCVKKKRKRKKYLNNPLCTVSKSLVLNAAVSSESSDLKNAFVRRVKCITYCNARNKIQAFFCSGHFRLFLLDFSGGMTQRRLKKKKGSAIKTTHSCQ